MARVKVSLPWAWPYLGCAALAIAAITLVDRPASSRVLGGADPLVVLCLAAAAGLVALAALRIGAPFMQSAPMTKRRVAVLAIVVAAFGLSAIGADLVLRFPSDLNVAWPMSAPFYVAMGFLAALCFQLIPLAVLVTIFRPHGPMLVLCVIVTAVIEALYQVRSAITGGTLSVLQQFVFAQVFAFGLFELYVLRRHGFVAMYGVRLAYYAIWHIGWGAARLPLLFG